MTQVDYDPKIGATNVAINLACTALVFGASRFQKNLIKIPAVIGAIGAAGLADSLKRKMKIECYSHVISNTLKHALDLAFFALAARGIRRWSGAGILGRTGIVFGTTLSTVWGAARLTDSTTYPSHWLTEGKKDVQGIELIGDVLLNPTAWC
jgi:hypothetical protein